MLRKPYTQSKPRHQALKAAGFFEERLLACRKLMMHYTSNLTHISYKTCRATHSPIISDTEWLKLLK
jgi:hypothetical protein